MDKKLLGAVGKRSNWNLLSRSGEMFAMVGLDHKVDADLLPWTPAYWVRLKQAEEGMHYARQLLLEARAAGAQRR